MKISLLELPSVYYRNGSAVVIFSGVPYWFSATQEIGIILEAFKRIESELIVDEIALLLKIEKDEAILIFNDVSDLLYSSGVISIDGKIKEMNTYSPDFQVNEVENVLVIATTQKCNMRCAMCYAMADKKMAYEMSTDEIKAIIDQLDGMPWKNKISRVALTGGELFTRSDALELIEYAYYRGFFVQVNTNATLLNIDQIEQLAKFDRLKLSVSLDGSRSEIHDFIRGKGNFDIAVNNIRLLCQKGVSVAVNMFVHSGNIDDIKDTLVLSQSLGVSGFNCLNMMNVGRGNDEKTKQRLIPVALGDFYRKVYLAIKDDENLQELMMYSTFANQLMGIAAGVKSFGCGIGTNRAVYVKADGSLYPCADTALPDFYLGNLRSDKLSDIWENSSLLKELRSLNIDTMNEKCAKCDVRYLCAGNCRGENYQTSKDLYNPHFKCEEIHESVLELMWILTENPNMFKNKADNLIDKVSSHASSA